MVSFISILFLFYIFLGIGVCIGYILQLFKERKKETAPSIDISELIVLIPFRNESERINNLIDDINNLTVKPNRFLFINDHSSDNTSSIIDENLQASISYSIIDLPTKIEGKKAAIRAGVNFRKCDYNLTWDADIRVQPSYFESIKKLNNADLHILPVRMKGKTFNTLYFEFDHTLANAMNVSVNGWKRTFLASGANLLFRQKTFLETDSFSSHQQFASGDDVFLLRDFRINNCSVELTTNSSLMVDTETPTSWKDFFNQRLRWIGKTTHLGDLLANSLAVTAFIFNIGFYFLFVWAFIYLGWEVSLLLFTVKTIVDLAVYFPYFYMIKRLKTWALLPVFGVIQPIYFITLAILLVTYKPTWKDRPI